MLGRTSRGLFGVQRSSDITPLDARPIFTAPFDGTVATRAADDLAQFLATAPELTELAARAEREPGYPGLRSTKASASATKTRTSAAAASAPAKTPTPKKSAATPPKAPASAARGKLAPKQAIALADQLVPDVLRRQGAGVALLFFTDDLAAARGALELRLFVNAPSDTDPMLLEHELPRRVAESLRSALRDATGHAVDVVLDFDVLDTSGATGRAHLERLAALVARTGDRDAEAYARRLARG